MERDPYERLENLLPESDELGIDGYETIAPIGEGGFGRVFRARQIAFSRDVAIKVLAASGMKDETVRRFERECTAVGTLSGHPNIVTIYDSGITRWGRPYIVMDYMPGGSFGDTLSRSGPVDQTSAIEAIVKISGAVETAHQAGILHRDIKPDNILLSAYGEPKLADFGVASIPGGYQTHTGAITASLAHAAPEVLEGQKATRAVDVYALGSTLFAMIDGRPAFSPSDDGGLQALIARTLTQPVPDLRLKGISDEICSVIETAMAKDPAERYDSVEGFGAALQIAQAAAGSAVTEMPLERAAIVAYPSQPPAPAESPTQLRARRELTPPQAAPGPRRVMWRSPLFAAALVLMLAVSSGSVIALRARDQDRSAPATSPQGEPPDVTAGVDEADESTREVAERGPQERRRPKQPRKKPSGRDGGNLSFAAPAGGGYPAELSREPGGDDGGRSGSYSPPSDGGSGGSSGGGTGGGGDAAGSQPRSEPEPVGSERSPDITFYYHWSDNGEYFFTADHNKSWEALTDYDYRTRLGRVWSSSRPGDGLTVLCPTPDRCEGFVSREPPKSGSYLTLYYHPGGSNGRFFSTDPSATYQGEAMRVLGYIRPI